MKNEEFGCAMQACRKVILHSSFLVLHFDKLSFTSKRLQRSDKFFAGGKSQIGQNWFNLEISKVYIIFVQHKITPNGLFHTHQKHQ